MIMSKLFYYYQYLSNFYNANLKYFHNTEISLLDSILKFTS